MKEKFVGKYMRLARQIAIDDNPCLSRQVGVVVVDPCTNGIVGAGYNGPPEGTPHCNDVAFLKGFFWPQLTVREKAQVCIKSGTMDGQDVNATCEFLSKCNECPRNMLGYSSGKRPELCSCQHAERNALNKLSIPAKGLVMFCWCGVPCIQCTGSIINAGIKELYCLKQIEDYHPAARWLYEKSSTTLVECNEAEVERSK
jgi:deoxycytidylate deaminase